MWKPVPAGIDCKLSLKCAFDIYPVPLAKNTCTWETAPRRQAVALTCGCESFCPVIPSFSSVRRRSLRLLRSIYHATCHEDTIITSSGQPSTIRSYREQARVNPENVCVFNKVWQVTCDGKDGQSGSSSGDPCFEIRQNRSVKFSYLKLY